jgi:hypothetical protein
VFVLLVAVGALALSLNPTASAKRPTADRSAMLPADKVPVAGTNRSPSAGSSGLAPSSAAATSPPGSSGSTPGTTGAATNAAPQGGQQGAQQGAPQGGQQAAPNPTASQISGINGGDDTTKVPSSEADTSWMANDAACSAWLDDNGSGALAGVLNTSLYQTCGAELFRSDGMAYSFSASMGAKKTNFIPAAGYTMWICVWNAANPSSTEVCSPHFAMNGNSPVKQ